jgi:hypothetical protein
MVRVLFVGVGEPQQCLLVPGPAEKLETGRQRVAAGLAHRDGNPGRIELTVSTGPNANSAMFDFTIIAAPASRSRRTRNASLPVIMPFSDNEPAVVGMSRNCP